MGNKTQNVGGGQSTQVANDWATMLGQGLQTGVYGMPQQQMPDRARIMQDMQNMSPHQKAQYIQQNAPSWNAQLAGGQNQQSMGQQQISPNMMPSQTGGLGVGQPGQTPQQQTMNQPQQNGGMGGGVGQLDQQAIANDPAGYAQWQQQAAQSGYNYNNQGTQQQNGGLPGYINNQLNSDPNSANYSNPNNPRPQNMVAPQQMQFNAQQYQNPNQTMQFGFDPQIGQGPSGLYDQANQGMMNLGNMYSQVAQQNPFQDFQQPNSPGMGGAGSFGSQGLLGDRGGVTNAITAASQRATQDAVAAARARFTANGGMAFGTPAAFAEAATTGRGNEALANSLAQQDLAYRNHDLGAYSAEQNAQIGHRGVNANIFGTQAGMYGDQLGAANQRGMNMISALNGMGQNYQNVAGNEFGQQELGYKYGALDQQGQEVINQQNLDSGLGFGQLGLDYSKLNENALQSANGLNLESGLGYGGLAQQAFNANSNNWANQGNMDMQQRGIMSAQQQNLINQLFGAYGQQAGLGTPQAQTIQVPTMGANIVNAISGALPGVAQVKKAFG